MSGKHRNRNTESDGLVDNGIVERTGLRASERNRLSAIDCLRQREPVLASYISDEISKIAGRLALGGAPGEVVRGVSADMEFFAAKIYIALDLGHNELWKGWFFNPKHGEACPPESSPPENPPGMVANPRDSGCACKTPPRIGPDASASPKDRQIPIPPGAEEWLKGLEAPDSGEYLSFCRRCGHEIAVNAAKMDRCPKCKWFVCGNCGACGCE